MPPTSPGIRFIDAISAEPAAVQAALSQMMEAMSVERAEEAAQLADTKARAIAAVEGAIAGAQEPSPRLAG